MLGERKHSDQRVCLSSAQDDGSQLSFSDAQEPSFSSRDRDEKGTSRSVHPFRRNRRAARTKHAVSLFDASARQVHVLENALEED